jgi:regulator of sigma E protease
MMQIFISILAFLIVITILVAIHEFGHFIVAKKSGVKVLCFSIGFGPKLLRFSDRSGTEYAFSLIPFGGYVKMLDENEGKVPENEKHLTFNRQHPFKKMAIVLAGPINNFLAAIFVLWIMFMIGIPGLQPIIGSVHPTSIAAQAGLKAGQKIIAVDGKPTRDWKQVERQVLLHFGEHDTLIMTTEDPKTQQKKNYSLSLASWKVLSREASLLNTLGVFSFSAPVEAVIAKVKKNSPAERAGLKAGDRIIAAQGHRIEYFGDFVRIIEKNAGQKVKVILQRDQETLHKTVVPDGILLSPGLPLGRIGIVSKPAELPANIETYTRYSLITGLGQAFRQTGFMINTSWQILSKMVQGKLSWRYVSGPVGIAKGAGLSFKRGITPFLSFLALISVGLGFVNLFPLPILDGGYVVFYGVEWLAGRPFPQRFQIWYDRLGLVLLLGLMLLTFWNDLIWW